MGYLSELNQSDESIFFILKQLDGKRLVIANRSECYNKFIGTEKFSEDIKFKVCPLSHQNAVALRELFPFTALTSVLESDKTIGLGDRLGVATAGHIRLLKQYDVKPMLAQQSIRELTLT